MSYTDTEIEGAHKICVDFSSKHVEDCAKTTVSQCYRKLALKTHPDKRPEYAADFRSIQEAHDASGTLRDTGCTQIPPRPAPSSYNPNAQANANPYAQAYADTSNEIPEGSSFEKFKVAFIANLIPVAVAFCIATIAYYGKSFKFGGGSSDFVPNGFRGGAGDKHTSKQLASEARKTAKYIHARGLGRTGPLSLPSLFNPTNRTVRRSDQYPLDSPGSQMQPVPGPPSVSPVGLAGMSYPPPPTSPPPKSRRRARHRNLDLAKICALFVMMMIPVVAAQNKTELMGLGNSELLGLGNSSETPDPGSKSKSESTTVAARITAELKPYNSSASKSLASPGIYNNLFNPALVEKLKQYCILNGIPVEFCSLEQIEQRVKEFGNYIASIPQFMGRMYEKLTPTNFQNPACGPLGLHQGFVKVPFVKEKGWGPFSDTVEMRDEAQYAACAYRFGKVMTANFKQGGGVTIDINMEMLEQNMRQLENFLPKYCPKENIPIILQSDQRRVNLKVFADALFNAFTLEEMGKVDPASTFNLCMQHQILRDVYNLLPELISASDDDPAARAFGPVFDLLETVTVSRKFLYETKADSDRFNEKVKELAYSKTWEGFMFNGAEATGRVITAPIAGAVFGFFEPFMDTRTVGALASIAFMCWFINVCMRWLNPVNWFSRPMELGLPPVGRKNPQPQQAPGLMAPPPQQAPQPQQAPDLMAPQQAPAWGAGGSGNKRRNRSGKRKTNKTKAAKTSKKQKRAGGRKRSRKHK